MGEATREMKEYLCAQAPSVRAIRDLMGACTMMREHLTSVVQGDACAASKQQVSTRGAMAGGRG